MAKEYTNLFPFQGPPKFTRIRIFGLKINHLATLFGTGNPHLFVFLPSSVRGETFDQKVFAKLLIGALQCYFPAFKRNHFNTFLFTLTGGKICFDLKLILILLE
jgi:hypothetical protein